MERKKLSIWLFAFVLFNSIQFILTNNISHVKLKLNKAFNNYSISLDREQSFQLSQMAALLNDTNEMIEMITASLNNYCVSHLSPPQCYSSTEMLDMSDINFRQIPVSLVNKWFGVELRELNMSSNSIGNLSLEFTSPRLEHVDLSFNQIGCIEAGSFRSLKSLKYLQKYGKNL